MAKEIEKHPLTEHLMKERGMLLKGWIRFNKLPYENNALNCIYNGYYDPPTIEKLREEGLYDLLYPEIRAKIEEQEAAKEAKEAAVNE